MVWILISAFGLAAVVLVLIPLGLRAVLGVKLDDKTGWRDRVASKYQALYRWFDLVGVPGAVHAWMFALLKMRLDPMFAELSDILNAASGAQTILDIGCGFGIAGCAVLEWIPGARIYGVDPAPGRVRVDRKVFGERGEAFVAAAPDFVRRGMPNRFDLVMVLDVIHFLPDSALAITLERIRAILNDGGLLVVRSILRPAGGGSIWWKFAQARRAVTGHKAFHRSAEDVRRALESAGFHVQNCATSGGNEEMCWFVATGGGGAGKV